MTAVFTEQLVFTGHSHGNVLKSPRPDKTGIKLQLQLAPQPITDGFPHNKKKKKDRTRIGIRYKTRRYNSILLCFNLGQKQNNTGGEEAEPRTR